MWDTIYRDVRQAARGLLRSASFTVVAIATLTIGIGATTAVYSVVDGVLLKPLQYPESERLLALWHDAPGAPGLTAVAGGLQMSPSMLVAYREHNRSFESVGLWAVGAGNVTGRGQPEEVARALVTGQTLATFGVAPLLGRGIEERDEVPNGPRVTLLSYGYWQERFGGDANVLGQRIEIDEVATEIVGVMPRGFRFGDVEADVIQAFVIDRAQLLPPPFCCNGVGRLKPGVTLEQASADIERMLPIWIDMFPFPGGRRGTQYLDTWLVKPALRTLKADVVGTVGDSLWVVLATIAIVLVIASANVANLLLVRGEGRARELEVRAALGAGSWRIARSLLAECLLLAAVAGVLGVALAYGALELLLELAPQQLPRLAELAIDGRSLTFAALVTLIAGATISLAPVLRAARARLSTGLRASRGTSAGRAQHRAQNVLVVGQVALALVLLVSSGLMMRTFEALQAVEPGFAAPDTLQTFRILAPQPADLSSRDVFVEQRAIVAALEALPGVSSVGFTNALPMEQVVTGWDSITVEGLDNSLQSNALRVFNMMSPGYLDTMGIRVVAGRDLTWADLEETRPVTLVSAGLASEVFGTPQAALGQRIRGGNGPPREIVGVVDDVRINGLDRAPPATVYWPSMMASFRAPLFIQRAVAFTVRSPLAGTPALLRQIEQAVWSVNPDLPVAAVRTMQDLYDRSMGRTSFTLVMLVVAAGTALVLGVVGLYGVLSYTVSTRRREIAIRFALGARPRDVEAQVVRQGVVLAVVGVAIGVAAAVGVTRLLTSLLYEVGAVDPLTYAAVAAGLIGVAAVASYLPARRASTVDPAESLAAE